MHTSPSSMTGTTRRTRIVCISDTHNTTVKLPKGDVLIHAGDLTNQGSHTELVRVVAWLERADFECKIVVAGNHDITLDKAFYAQHSGRFHNQVPQSSDQCRALLESSPTITYLCHESADIRLESKEGPRTEFTVFGSPYSPRDGTWAFSYQPTNDSGSSSSAAADPGGLTSETLWSEIPANADIVVTHTPPRTHCDWSTTRGRSMGCAELLHALQRVQPRLAVCGHVHEGRGAEWVRWSAVGNGPSVERWDDPGSGKKMSLVNIAARTSKPALDAGSSAAEGHGGCRETCIVNCAITATNYPHVGGKRLHKPIVVDLNLPVWKES